jgi:hypothetical protein
LAGGLKDRSRILRLNCYGNGIDEEDAERPVCIVM